MTIDNDWCEKQLHMTKKRLARVHALKNANKNQRKLIGMFFTVGSRDLSFRALALRWSKNALHIAHCCIVYEWIDSVI